MFLSGGAEIEISETCRRSTVWWQSSRSWQKPARKGLGSMVMIKGAEASALLHHIDPQGKDKYFHFDSHGSHDITGSTHGYLICFPSRGAFVEYLDKRYTFVEVDGDLYEHTQGLFQMNYNAVELREVSMRL